MHIFRQRFLEDPLHLPVYVLEIFIALVLDEVDNSLQRQFLVNRRRHVSI